MISRIERNYIYSLGTTEEWQEERRQDMQVIRDLMALAEKFQANFQAKSFMNLL